jgi:hypothetical protein
MPLMKGIRTIVAVEPLRDYQQAKKGMLPSEDLHCTECENDTNGDLLSLAHLQSLDNKYRDDAKGPIGDTTQGGVAIE